ncbi:hypothetical protein THARTR1_08466 [Trichoderma harzianum]|uniref:Uncharacterized protein n=1 Tax=Trichoderma harzianum TaxID=5544 RepID=A0A2K0TZA3_TRIHA|nr:hypothetical protein THARTR1_08466 [Trichoderma harzianum]
MAAQLLIHYCLVTLLLQDTYSYHRSFDLKITAIIDPELDIGWISHVTVSLFYRRRLIGEKTRRNTYIILDKNNEACISLQGVKIRDMIGFKAFMQRLMPKSEIIRQKEGQTFITAAVDKDDNGHNLSVAIDLNDISSVSISNVDCQATDEEVELTFKVLSLNPVDLPFGYCKFSLTKDETLLASLKGHFDIFPDYCDIDLTGTCEATDVKFAGSAILKGVQAFDHAGSWIDRAIQLFEVEIKLD